MVSLILGKKGSGKTKKLLDRCNEATRQADGCVVFIEKDNSLTYDVSHKARLVAADDYGVADFDCFYGYIAGMCAGNYDITDIFVDATLRIGGRDYNELAKFISRLQTLSDSAGTNFTLTVSADKADLPGELHALEMMEATC
ncbi:MAG: hypothetical protein FWF49_03480 [Oscillospiraceae bacterium]|nr:hypothetical protein [Oscillospiraceae bacterium]